MLTLSGGKVVKARTPCCDRSLEKLGWAEIPAKLVWLRRAREIPAPTSKGVARAGGSTYRCGGSRHNLCI